MLSYDDLAYVIAELGFDGIEGTIRPGGQITPETLVWSQGMAAWTPAIQVPQLAELFAAPPPPPPVAPPAPPA